MTPGNKDKSDIFLCGFIFRNFKLQIKRGKTWNEWYIQTLLSHIPNKIPTDSPVKTTYFQRQSLDASSVYPCSQTLDSMLYGEESEK